MHHIFVEYDTHDTLMTADAFEQKYLHKCKGVLNKNMDSPLHQSVVAE